jgi:hypothetical protein
MAAIVHPTPARVLGRLSLHSATHVEAAALAQRARQRPMELSGAGGGGGEAWPDEIARFPTGAESDATNGSQLQLQMHRDSRSLSRWR